MDDFIIEEATERLPPRPRPKAGASSGKLLTVGARAHVNAVSAFDRAFPALSNGAPATCEVAYELAQSRPRWKENDIVEVAFNGKGYEGSWATATVVKPDGKKHILVRYDEFVDNDGTPLVEQSARTMPAAHAHARACPLRAPHHEGGCRAPALRSCARALPSARHACIWSWAA